MGRGGVVLVRTGGGNKDNRREFNEDRQQVDNRRDKLGQIFLQTTCLTAKGVPLTIYSKSLV